MEDYWYKPHFYAHILSGLALFTALVLLAYNYKKLLRKEGLEIVSLMSVLAIATAAHGQSHTTLEKEYGYDPLYWFYSR